MSVRRCVLGAAAAALAVPAASAEASLVFTQTNASPVNELVVFDSDANGTLTELGRHPTGGAGLGSNPPFGRPILDSQGSVIRSGRFVLVANAGSNTVSVFRVEGPTGPFELTDVEPSGGTGPVSLVAFRRFVYVLNRDSESAAGFRLTTSGRFAPLRVTVPLSPGGLPAQIAVTPQGYTHQTVVVSERGTDTVASFPVGSDGIPDSAADVRKTRTDAPFGMAFRPARTLLLSSAGSQTGAEDAEISLHDVQSRWGLEFYAAKRATRQAGSSWLTLTDRFVHYPDGRRAQIGYVSNPLSRTLTVIRVGGACCSTNLRLLPPDGDSAFPSGVPLDIAQGPGFPAKWIHVLTANDGTGGAFAGADIETWRINPDGSLSFVSQTPATLPPGTSGLAG
jgi:6-phosphogluconolactonase